MARSPYHWFWPDLGPGPGKKAHKRLKPITRWAHLLFEPLEDRLLFSINVFLPQRPAPIGGISQNQPAFQLFTPATTQLTPLLDLNSGSISVAGSFVLNDTGTYTLSLQESGPQGAGSFVYTEAGPVTYSLTEQGNVTQGGVAVTSIVLTQTVSLGWTYLQTDSSGHTVQYQTGTDTFTIQSLGTAVLDPLFWSGFNWRDPTQHISDAHALSLASLSATSFTVNETAGSESYSFQVTSANETISGNATQALADLSETGQESYAVTDGLSFTFTNQGSNTFTLAEQGAYANGSYSFSSVAYHETGSNSFQLSETGTISQSGTATESATHSFTGHNHTLSYGGSDSFQFTSLNTFAYGETGSGTNSLTESGTYGGGCFSLGSVNYSAQGSGTLSLTESGTQTSTVILPKIFAAKYLETP
jgi:hypothetical protein